MAEELFGDDSGRAARCAPVDVAAPCRARRARLSSRIASSCRGCIWRGRRRRCSPPATPSWISSADLLANGRTSRLYRRLIHDRRIAAELAAAQSSRELGGTFQIVATAAPGHTLDELEAAIREEIARFADDGPTDDELAARPRAGRGGVRVSRLQTLGGFGGKADQLNAYNVYTARPTASTPTCSAI